jgi:hypothetical protein
VGSFPEVWVRYLKAGWAPVPMTATLLNMGKETL